MAPPEVVVSQWYEALLEEDCLRVMQLLKDYPSLLKRGWRSEPSRVFEGSSLNFWKVRTPRPWMGRSVLHVGARRGCTELIKQVIQLCHEGDLFSSYKEMPMSYQNSFGKSSYNEGSSVSSFREFGVSPEYWDLIRNEGDDRGTRNVADSSRSQDHALVASQGDRQVAVDREHEGGGLQQVDSLGRSFGASSASENIETLLVAAEGDRHKPQRLPHLSELKSSSNDEVHLSTNKVEENTSSVSNSECETGDREPQATAQLTVANWRREVEERTVESLRRMHHAFMTKMEDHREDHSDLDESEDRSVSFKDFLLLKDGEYKLDAIAMAVLHGNLDIISLLMSSVKRDQEGPQSLNWDELSDHRRRDDSNGSRARLRVITEGVIAGFLRDQSGSGYVSYRSIFAGYSRHRDFNFLPRDEYLFHYLFTDPFALLHDHNNPSRLHQRNNNTTSWVQQARRIREYLWEELRLCADSLCFYLLKLQDGQGRTPMHVAVDEGTMWAMESLLLAGSGGEMEFKENVYKCALTAPDAAGRTALHRAVAMGNGDAITAMRSMTPKALWAELMFQKPWRHPLISAWASSLHERGIDVHDAQVDELSERNGFQADPWVSLDDTQAYELSKRNIQMLRLRVYCSPLHIAIIHRRTQVLDLLLEGLKESWRLVPADVHFAWGLDRLQGEGLGGPHVELELDTLELASLMGDVRTVRRLSEEGFKQSSSSFKLGSSGGIHIKNLWPALHLAASSGNYELVKYFLESRFCDPFIEDFDGNTALHHALGVRKIEFKTHLLDYVNCEHISMCDPRKTTEENLGKDLHSHVERQGCINLLLQAGCEIFKTNKNGQVPYPRGNLGSNASFLSWWYEKQAKEFKMIQNSMSFVANAISVTATLVATASFVGPLQPPLGYQGDPADQLQVENIWVRIFIVCDTLSFYLAIAAITFSLIPSLPMPQQAMLDELRRTRGMVTFAIAILLPSILCIFIAFASSSVVVIGPYVTSSIGGRLIITTASIGGLFCLVGFFLLLIRLLGCVFPQNTFVRFMYNFTSF